MSIDIMELLINISVASVGGLVKRLTEAEKRPKRKCSFSYYLIGSLVSMFVGAVVYAVCKNFAVTGMLTLGLCALSGYIGAPVLDILSQIAKKRLEKAVGEDAEEEKEPLKPEKSEKSDER